MKVLVNCLSAGSGGALSYLRNLVPLLAKKFASTNDHNLIVLIHRSQITGIGSHDDVNFEVLDGLRPVGYRRILWEKANLNKIINRLGIDVLFIPYQVSHAVPNGVKLVLMIRNMEVFCYHKYRYGLRGLARNYLLKKFASRSLRRADRVIAVSSYAGNYVTERLCVNKEKIKIIYHGADTTFGLTTYDSSLMDSTGPSDISRGYIFTAGSLLPYRKCENVIKAFSEMQMMSSEKIDLVIAGGGNDKNYYKLIQDTIAKSGVKSQIHLEGHVSRERMIELYKNCLLFVTATEVEACPNIAIESMSSGCVVLSCDSPPMPEMYGDAALYFRSGSYTECAKKMMELLNNETLRGNFKRKALVRVQEFSWRRCADELFQFLIEW